MIHGERMIHEWENIPSPKAKVIRKGGYVFVGNLGSDKGLRGDVGDVHPQVPWGGQGTCFVYWYIPNSLNGTCYIVELVFCWIDEVTGSDIPCGWVWKLVRTGHDVLCVWMERDLILRVRPRPASMAPRAMLEMSKAQSCRVAGTRQDKAPQWHHVAMRGRAPMTLEPGLSALPLRWGSPSLVQGVGWDVCAKLLQSCLTLCTLMDRSPPGSSDHGILQARILEWVAMPSSSGSSPSRDWTCVSYVSCFGRRVLYYEHHLGSSRVECRVLQLEMQDFLLIRLWDLCE